jgi:hypothetical protein
MQGAAPSQTVLEHRSVNCCPNLLAHIDSEAYLLILLPMLFPQMWIARFQHPGLENGLEQIGGGCILGAASAASAKRPGTAPEELLSASLPTDKPAMLAYNCQILV